MRHVTYDSTHPAWVIALQKATRYRDPYDVIGEFSGLLSGRRRWYTAGCSLPAIAEYTDILKEKVFWQSGERMRRFRVGEKAGALRCGYMYSLFCRRPSALPVGPHGPVLHAARISFLDGIGIHSPEAPVFLKSCLKSFPTELLTTRAHTHGHRRSASASRTRSDST